MDEKDKKKMIPCYQQTKKTKRSISELVKEEIQLTHKEEEVNKKQWTNYLSFIYYNYHENVWLFLVCLFVA